ncbi:aminoglycoside phosphotransferase [Desertihabitans brevis]|uniref:Aminoglycoside phosphotransferase n=1 Tax=Desertihabitans brevis TaxID=2268447 RepID=A0A367YZY8_9ACTN|nr:aminoglycoside phosphotransferase family protein [Desertihabitans brevis]RCK71079.1 aminoglycoside phosphotransferase [Desertihabitans brevis]
MSGVGVGDVPAVVRARAGAGGDPGWADRLPRLLADLARAWSLTVTGVLAGGTASVVVRAVAADGRPVVVKVAVPGTGSARQVQTLLSAAGNGYVQVLAYAPEYEAVLLEALGTSLEVSGWPPGDQLVRLARLLRRAWQVTPSAAAGPPEDKAAGLAALVSRLWHDLARPCPEPVVVEALACAARRAADFDPSACVVVHGDAAAANAARVLAPRPGTEDGFVLLDPDGFVGDPTYDLGVAVRDWCPQLLASRFPADLLAGWCETVAGEADADPAVVWDWGFLERVSTGLFLWSLDGREQARPFLETAEVLLAAGSRW